MKRIRGRVIEVDSVADFDHRIARGAVDLSGWRLRGLDLTTHSATLGHLRVTGALFLGCRFADGDQARVEAGGAVVFPALPDAPVEVYRQSLYTARELYDAPTYATSLDARGYGWSQVGGDRDASLARALHDHAIDDALETWVRGRRIVGVMGGHALRRDEPGYAEAARLGHALALRLGPDGVVATGGGPGAMEAANLGGRLADAPSADLESALDTLTPSPGFRPSIDAWVEPAFRVIDSLSTRPRPSLGIPTWHYGHEPPNVFATAIAKYFRNAQREAILLQICTAGIVFLPGAAGTVQEVFQDACENYYADASSVAPMVLVGKAYWTHTLPVWPLLKTMAAAGPMAGHIHLVDTLDDAAAAIG